MAAARKGHAWDAAHGDPGPIRTDFYGRSRERAPTPADGAYDAIVEQCDAISLTAADRGGAEPTVVADTIVRAIEDRGWRLRYPVAAPAPLLLRLRRLMPESVFFGLIRRRYGLR